MTLRERAGHVAAGMVLAFVLSAAVVAWHNMKPSLPAVLGQPDETISNRGTEPVPCTQLQAAKAPAKQDAGLPAPVVQDPQASLVAASPVPRVDYPLLASAVIHRDTGLGEIYFTPRPRPWLAFDSPRPWTFELGYGLAASPDLDPRAAIYAGAQYQPVELKRAQLGGAAHVYSTGFVWAGGNLRF